MSSESRRAIAEIVAQGCATELSDILVELSEMHRADARAFASVMQADLRAIIDELTEETRVLDQLVFYVTGGV